MKLSEMCTLSFIFIWRVNLGILLGSVLMVIVSVISSSRFPISPRPDSVHSTTSSSDSHDSEENYVPMNPNLSGEDPVCEVCILISPFLSSPLKAFFFQPMYFTLISVFPNNQREPCEMLFVFKKVVSQTKTCKWPMYSNIIYNCKLVENTKMFVLVSFPSLDQILR